MALVSLFAWNVTWPVLNWPAYRKSISLEDNSLWLILSVQSILLCFWRSRNRMVSCILTFPFKQIYDFYVVVFLYVGLFLWLFYVRGCLHDSGISSFQNEFIPSPYISLYLFTWYRDEISFPYKSFRNEFIPVFIPNEILVLVWHFILVSCKLKTNSVPRWNPQTV